jgi:hypothetical protein
MLGRSRISVKRLFGGVLVAFLLVDSAAVAAPLDKANNPGRPGTAVAQGQCSRLITGADDYTAKCDPQAASVTLADGTVSFIFTIEGTPVVFSGDGKSVVRAFDGAMKLPIKFVAIGKDAKLGAFEADGSCAFGDPYSGAAIIWCAALTEAGPFVVTFKTDGSQPVEIGH